MLGKLIFAAFFAVEIFGALHLKTSAVAGTLIMLLGVAALLFADYITTPPKDRPRL